MKRPRVGIEQAIARGETVEQICQRLDVDPAVVHEIRAEMDAINAEVDRTTTQPSAMLANPADGCGTPAAYKRHARRGEPIDDLCREAFNADRRRRYSAARRRRHYVAGRRPTSSAATVS